MRYLSNRTVQLIITSSLLVVLLSRIKPDSDQAINKVEYDRFWSTKVHSRKKYDMLILGDSRIYRGISPQEINTVLTGLRVCNFAFSSAILDNELYDEAEKRMKTVNHGIILLGISPGCLIDYENKQLQEIKKYTKAEVFDRMYAAYFLSRYFLPVKPSDIFEDNVVLSPDYVKETYFENGWVSSVPKYYDHSKHLKEYSEFWSGNKISENKVEDLCKRIAKWEKQGYAVFSFRAPASYEIDSLENGLSGFNEDTIKMKIEKAGGTWIRLDAVYDNYKSYDGCHLDEQSARKLSKCIALEIKKDLQKDLPYSQ